MNTLKTLLLCIVVGMTGCGPQFVENEEEELEPEEMKKMHADHSQQTQTYLKAQEQGSSSMDDMKKAHGGR